MEAHGSGDLAVERMREALRSLDMEPESDGSTVRAKAPRSLRKNRWAAEVAIDVRPLNGGSIAVVDMAGNKHYALMNELAEAVRRLRVR